ncbi:MAG: glycosyltransferase [Candidatus Sericytochromatia bacterium]
MIARDEERFIGRALASVCNLAEEIIVLDTGSTDATCEIARSAGARVSTQPWRGSFAAARNASLELATGDWVLVLDADEQLAPGSADVVSRLIEHGQEWGVEACIRSYLDQNDAATATEHYLLRLFPRWPHLRYQGRIHEQLVNQDPTRPLERRYCPELLILHDGYQADVFASRAKQLRNRELLIQAIAEEPENAFHYFNLAQNQQNAGEKQEALQTLEYCLQLAPEQAAYVVPAWIQRIGLVLELQGGASAQACMQLTPQACHGNPDYWITHAGVLLLHGNAREAISAYERAAGFLRNPPQAQARYERASMTWKPYAGIAQCWSLLGHPECALLYLQQALAQCPANPLVQQQFAELERKLGAITHGPRPV